MPKLSIIMPLYNEAARLERCLKSVIAQQDQNFELIMVNDASTDQTPQIATRFIRHHSNMSLLTQPSNQGISAARNRGMRAAQGELITFIDGDDWLEPQYTSYFLQKFAQRPLDMVVCGYVREPQRAPALLHAKHFQGYCGCEEVLRHITKNSGQVKGYTWNKVYRLALINKYHLQFESDLSLMEDQVFNVQYATHAQHFYIGTQPLYHYWQHNQSATHTYDLESAKSVGLANYRIVKTLLKSKKSQK